MSKGIIRRRILTGEPDNLKPLDEAITEEREFCIRANGELVWQGTCSPGQERELAAGRLQTMGLATTPDAISSLVVQDRQALVAVDLNAPAEAKTRLPKVDHETAISLLPGLMEHMHAHQVLFHATGGTHCAALFDAHGALLSLAEDIARHNALDKVVGDLFLTGRLHDARIATLSSRLSGELVAKCAQAGIPVLAGCSAATSLGVSMAKEHGILLVGRLRGRSMKVYAK